MIKLIRSLLSGVLIVGASVLATPRWASAQEALPEPGDALLVVGSTTLNPDDSAVYGRLTTLGYTVTVRDGATAAGADATGKKLVLISQTVNATDVGTKFQTAAVPVLVWKPALFDEM